MPALPLDEAGKYVAAAFLVFLALLLVYVAIMAGRLGRIERELTDLTRALDQADGFAVGADASQGEPKAPPSDAVVSQGDASATVPFSERSA